MNALISGHDLCLFRGDKCLFDSLEFALNPGQLLIVEGSNGSGKTSLLRGIAGLLEFEQGEIHWEGNPLRGHYQAFRADLTWFAHKVGFKDDLNLLENLRFEQSLHSFDEGSVTAVLARLGLDLLTELPLRSLSAGQQRRVALARMLLSKGRVWMMDEPFTNLDSAGRSLVDAVLSEHLANGGSAIVATHQPLEIVGDVKRVSLS
ncbi:MAG: cytochrome c biogenesis heme-transporting ATPase CcmA [Woeseia sp.]|nr:cytochrome c biogenesis heme-transporting ATPase CcmA [Woeseia sp.]